MKTELIRERLYVAGNGLLFALGCAMFFITRGAKAFNFVTMVSLGAMLGSATSLVVISCGLAKGRRRAGPRNGGL